MRYSADQVMRTRNSIVLAAGQLFRRHGFEAVSIDDIMAACDLTRGSFYHHFASKNQLLAEALQVARYDIVSKLQERRSEKPKELRQEALRRVRMYLEPDSRDYVRENCPLAALPADAVRAGKAAREAFQEKFTALADELQRGSPGSAEDRAQAFVAIVLCAGGVLLSSAVSNPSLARQISAACQDAVSKTFANARKRRPRESKKRVHSR